MASRPSFFRDALLPPLLRPRREVPEDAGPIHDNAKRSVSIRINTSDYGRIKIAARRLRAKEADIFRYLLQVGLARLSPVLGDSLGEVSYLRALAELGPDLAMNFDVDAQQFADLIEALSGQVAPELEDTDLELVNLAATHASLVQARLEELTGREIALADLRNSLFHYLAKKYLP